CILGAIKEVVSLLSRTPKSDTSALVEEILDFGLRGVARPELLEAAERAGNGASGAGFLFARN
ncbi:MAG: hypothetical protein WBE78_02820, partial [Candidatus Binataceae bacterium]